MTLYASYKKAYIVPQMNAVDKDGGIATLIDEDLSPAVEGGSVRGDVQQPRLLLREVDPDRFAGALSEAQDVYEQKGARGVKQYLSANFPDFGPQIHSAICRRLQEKRDADARLDMQKNMIRVTFRNICGKQSTQQPTTAPSISAPLNESLSSVSSQPHSPEHVRVLAFLQLSRISSAFIRRGRKE